MEEINNVITIPTTIEGKFFRYWIEFLRPFHSLSNREMEVFACFLKHRYNLSKVILDPVLLEKLATSEDTKKQIKEECNLTTTHFQVLMTKLKKENMIVNNIINPKFVPRLNKDSNSFQLLLSFNFNES